MFESITLRPDPEYVVVTENSMRGPAMTHALEVATGKAVIAASPAPATDTAYLSTLDNTEGGELIRVKNGELVCPEGADALCNSARSLLGAIGAVAVIDGIAFLDPVDHPGRVVALDVATGSMKWTLDLSRALGRSPGLVLFWTLPGELLVTIDCELFRVSTSGAVLSHVALPVRGAKSPHTAFVLEHRSRLLVSCDDYLSGLSRDTGLPVWRFDLGRGAYVLPTAAGSRLLLVTRPCGRVSGDAQ